MSLSDRAWSASDSNEGVSSSSRDDDATAAAPVVRRKETRGKSLPLSPKAFAYTPRGARSGSRSPEPPPEPNHSSQFRPVAKGARSSSRGLGWLDEGVTRERREQQQQHRKGRRKSYRGARFFTFKRRRVESDDKTEVSLIRTLTEGELAAACLTPSKGFHSPSAHMLVRAQTVLVAVILPMFWELCKLDIAVWGLTLVHTTGQEIT